MSSDDKSTHRDWLELAKQAANETDTQKLVALVRELCDALDHRTPSAPEKPVNKKSDTAD